MLTNKLVSVVIPIYNGEKFIKETIECALNQTHKNLEILVVDDGSTDSSRQICQNLSREYPRVKVFQKDNGGVASARNYGIERANGEFIAFLDADDLWHPTKIEKQVAILEGHSPDWAAVYSLSRTIDANGTCISPDLRRIARGYIFASHLALKYIGNGSSLLVRTSVAREVGGFDPSYAAAGIGGCEDFDFELRIAQKYKIDCLAEHLVGYRHYPGNMSSNHGKMARGLSAVVEKFIASSPFLDGYAIRLARGATHLYALDRFIAARDCRSALAALLVAIRNDPTATTLFFRSLLVRAYIFVRRKLGIPSKADKKSAFLKKGLKYTALESYVYDPKAVPNTPLSRFEKLRQIDRLIESRIDTPFRPAGAAASIPT
ncbi:putative glycosyltransferase EpsH [Hartmannibacter diazotrophicus]|uniref:Putative glycosyltransferase EpsH n=1 Tax=Hartmannibacter diazotrophicus TaxID=1482074 RepID=A0A2C9D5F7_9HYPH|nr:glycosyltransferase family A protein [Hartmannibacter diazotrophicus]SON55557.1 putative glycosyltransferase EpsH [Hartmannibacter diazotrophicus]